MISRASTAKIHIAKTQLGMDNDTYRLVLRTYGGVNSATVLSLVGAAKVLAYIERCGFKSTAPSKGRRQSTTQDRSPLLRKIETQLADAGRAWAYVDAMAQRMFKVDKVSWLDSERMGRIVAALAYDVQRRKAKE